MSKRDGKSPSVYDTCLTVKDSQVALLKGTWSQLPNSHYHSRQATLGKLTSHNQTRELPQRHEEQTGEYTQTQPKLTTLPKFTRHMSSWITPAHKLSREQHTQSQPKVSVTTEDILACLHRGRNTLVMEGEEVWLNLSYKGNTSVLSRLSQPSTCMLKVNGRGPGVMSLLIFHVTCFTDNRISLLSPLRHGHVYKCDPTAWVAPGFELLMRSNVVQLHIEISDVNTSFSLHAQFKTVPARSQYKLEVRKVTQRLGACAFWRQFFLLLFKTL